MTSILSLRPAFALRTTTAASLALRRNLAVSAPHQIKESSGEDEDFEKHKQDSLAKHKEGKAHWKPELASDGEEAVRADRSPIDPQEDFRKMQERTKHHANESAKTGTSSKDPM